MKTKQWKPTAAAIKRKLPAKLSSLAKIALADLKAVEQQPQRFDIDMAEWHAPPYQDSQTLCTVCLAGSVLANTMQCPDEVDIEEIDLGQVAGVLLWDRLRAINCLRKGFIGIAAESLGIALPDECPESMRIQQYAHCRVEFKRDFRKLIEVLEEHGL